MRLVHHRTQHPVGQGSFHSGDVHFFNAAKSLSYVYDCGSMPMFDAAREIAIERYLNRRTELDILFLSHIHVDHVRGVPRLLARMRTRAVVLPLLTLGERLAAYLDAVNDDGQLAGDPFLLDLAMRPAETLAALGAEEVIFVRRGAGDAPGADGVALPDPFPPEPSPEPEPGERDIDGRVRDVEGERGWILVGGRGIRKTLVKTSGRTVPVTIVGDDSAFVAGHDAAASDDSGTLWRLATFVDDEIVDLNHLFVRALLGADPKATVKAEDLTSYANATDAITDIVTTKLPFLQAAYRALASNLNFTSMSLFSGPIQPYSTLEHHFLVTRAPGLRCLADLRTAWLGTGDAGRAAWLGTGDADLKTQKRRRRFQKHFGDLLDEVATLVVPHHGSENNFDGELARRIEPNLCVVPAAQYRDWRHPGTKVVQDIASEGIPLAVVTDKAASEVNEFVFVGK